MAIGDLNNAQCPRWSSDGAVTLSSGRSCRDPFARGVQEGVIGVWSGWRSVKHGGGRKEVIQPFAQRLLVTDGAEPVITKCKLRGVWGW